MEVGELLIFKCVETGGNQKLAEETDTKQPDCAKFWGGFEVEVCVRVFVLVCVWWRGSLNLPPLRNSNTTFAALCEAKYAE